MTTTNSREIEDIVKEFNRRYYNDEFGYPDGEFTFTFVTDYLRNVLHLLLQKARHDWLREEIVRLDYEKKENLKKNCEDDKNPMWNIRQDGYRQAIQTIIDRYQKELGQGGTTTNPDQP